MCIFRLSYLNPKSGRYIEILMNAEKNNKGEENYTWYIWINHLTNKRSGELWIWIYKRLKTKKRRELGECNAKKRDHATNSTDYY